jgi:Cof subfamily protein (haloacid dehalogenase superfamily)
MVSDSVGALQFAMTLRATRAWPKCAEADNTMEPIRLLVMDLDGTLLPHGGVISARTVDAIRAAQAKGVIATISSGRNIPSFLPYAQRIGVDGPLIGMQGAIARELPAPGDPSVGRLVRHIPFESQLGAEAIAWCKEHGLWGHTVVENNLHFDDRDPHAVIYRGWMEGSAHERLATVPDLVAHLAATPLQLSKVVAHAPAGHADGVLEAARATFGDRLDVTISHPEYLEFTAPGVNKGAALRWLAERLEIPLAQTMAIGDQHNDLEMLAAAGHGVAMGGAPAAVLAAARYEARLCEEDGAARMIERLILNSGGE